MIKSILLATDFTHITERAKNFAMDMARSMRSKVTLIHAIEDIEGATDEVQGFLEGRKKNAQIQAQEMADEFAAQDIECDIKVVIGKRWKAVVDEAAGGHYDLVVLGSHKIRDGEKVYLGTTTHKVFFAVDVPLMVVPPA